MIEKKTICIAGNCDLRTKYTFEIDLEQEKIFDKIDVELTTRYLEMWVKNMASGDWKIEAIKDYDIEKYIDLKTNYIIYFESEKDLVFFRLQYSKKDGHAKINEEIS